MKNRKSNKAIKALKKKNRNKQRSGNMSMIRNHPSFTRDIGRPVIYGRD